MLSYLSDTLAVLATEEDSPGDAARVLSLQEQRLGLAILESEGLAVATDVQLTLQLQNRQHIHILLYLGKRLRGAFDHDSMAAVDRISPRSP